MGHLDSTESPCRVGPCEPTQPPAPRGRPQAGLRAPLADCSLSPFPPFLLAQPPMCLSRVLGPSLLQSFPWLPPPPPVFSVQPTLPLFIVPTHCWCFSEIIIFLFIIISLLFLLVIFLCANMLFFFWNVLQPH